MGGQTLARRVGSKYRITRELGRGPNGAVWAGEGPDGAVAVKLLRTELATDETLVSRFVRGRATLTALAHPNLVGLRDIVADGDDLALVMDLVSGTDLRRRMSLDGTSGTPLTPALAAAIAADIASGLAAAHSAGVLHRDLKPENVLLSGTDETSGDTTTDSGRRLIARVSDVGIARLIGGPPAEGSARVTGTPDYVAPELVEDCQPGAPADVYALGTLLFEMLAGWTPFGGGSRGAVLRRHVTEPVPELPDCPKGLAEIVSSCLSKGPAARLTAPELAERLRGLLPDLAGLPALRLADPRGAERREGDGSQSSEGARSDTAGTRRGGRRATVVPLVVDDDPGETGATHFNLMKPIRETPAHDRPGHDTSAAPAGVPASRRRRALSATLVVLLLAAVTASVTYLALRDHAAQESQQEQVGSTAPAETVTTLIERQSATPGAAPVFGTPLALPALPTKPTGGMRVVNVGNDVDAFATGGDGSLWFTRSPGGRDFTAWQRITGQRLAAPPAVVALSDQVVLIALTSGGDMYQRTLVNGRPSAAWQALPMPYWHPVMTGAPGAAAISGGRIALVVATADGGLVDTIGTPGHWQGWFTPATDTALGPGVAVAPTTDGFDAYVTRRADGMLLDLPYRKGSWQTATPVDTIASGTPQAAVVGGFTYVAVRNPSGTIAVFRFVDGAWHGSSTGLSSSGAPGLSPLPHGHLAVLAVVAGQARVVISQ
jgi:serine/threonine-protein kinase